MLVVATAAVTVAAAAVPIAFCSAEICIQMNCQHVQCGSHSVAWTTVCNTRKNKAAFWPLPQKQLTAEKFVALNFGKIMRESI